MSVLKALVKNLIKENFDITVKTLIASFSFPIKTFYN